MRANLLEAKNNERRQADAAGQALKSEALSGTSVGRRMAGL